MQPYILRWKVGNDAYFSHKNKNNRSKHPDAHVTSEINDLINKWGKYEEESLQRFSKNSIQPKCPVYHCVFSGFQTEADFKLLEYFNKSVKTNKEQLIEILRSDADDIKRARVAYLLGHLQSPDEIISIMLDRVDDRSSFVRNNTMRVLSETMRYSKKTNINLEKVIKALSSPSTTDRNKAGGIIYMTAIDKNNHEYIIKNAGSALIKMLKLKQPNNHDIAYLILKTISGENYKDTDVVAWTQWLDRKTNVF